MNINNDLNLGSKKDSHSFVNAWEFKFYQKKTVLITVYGNFLNFCT
jgi:hypothetical protein